MLYTEFYGGDIVYRFNSYSVVKSTSGWVHCMKQKYNFRAIVAFEKKQMDNKLLQTVCKLRKFLMFMTLCQCESVSWTCRPPAVVGYVHSSHGIVLWKSARTESTKTVRNPFILHLLRYICLLCFPRLVMRQNRPPKHETYE